MDTSPILGTWRLLSWYNENESGERHYSLAEAATGYISYTLDGFFCSHISACTPIL